MYACLCIHVCGAHGGQRRAPDPPGTRVTGGCELPCGFWETEPGSSVRAALTTDPSLHSTFQFLHLHSQRQQGLPPHKAAVWIRRHRHGHPWIAQSTARVDGTQRRCLILSSAFSASRAIHTRWDWPGERLKWAGMRVQRGGVCGRLDHINNHRRQGQVSRHPGQGRLPYSALRSRVVDTDKHMCARL